MPIYWDVKNFTYLLTISYISSLDNLKASFHCSHLSKKFQIFTAVHKSNVLNSAAKIHLSNLSPNLSAYIPLDSKNWLTEIPAGTASTLYRCHKVSRSLLLTAIFYYVNLIVEHGTKVKPIFQTDKIGIGCLLIKKFYVNTQLFDTKFVDSEGSNLFFLREFIYHVHCWFAILQDCLCSLELPKLTPVHLTINSFIVISPFIWFVNKDT